MYFEKKKENFEENSKRDIKAASSRQIFGRETEGNDSM